MAKQKDHGDLLEIFFDSKRDTIKKFLKIVRKTIGSERKDLYIHMMEAPNLPSDFLSSLVLGTKGLKSHGYNVTFKLSSSNYNILKTSEDHIHFKFEYKDVASTTSTPPPKKETGRVINPNKVSDEYFSVINNLIVVKEEGMESIPTELHKFIKRIFDSGFDDVYIDLTQLFFITPKVIQCLILETLNFQNSLTIRILESMNELLKSNPQSKILNVEIVDELMEKSEPSLEVSEPEKKKENFVLDFEEEAFGLPESKPEPIIEPKEEQAEEEFSMMDADLPEVIKLPDIKADFPERDKKQPEFKEEDFPLPLQNEIDTNLDENGGFRIEVNALIAGPMSSSQFISDFDNAFANLFSCGDQLYIDLSEYERLESQVALRIIKASFEARVQNKKLTVRLLKDQKEKMEFFLPKFEKIEKKEDTTPKFIIEGSKMEIHHVDMDLFLEKFSEHFKKLMGTGQKKLFIDISHLKEVSDRAIELIVLCYLEAVGNGLSLVLRIRPEMEEGFLKSGRGRTLPLEIIKPEISSKVRLADKKKKMGIDMSKINKAIETDKLGQKILEKDYASVHIESRGTVGNWEPITTTFERESIYTGPERRIEKRYKAVEMQVLLQEEVLLKLEDVLILFTI